jgi:hypothetical protein
MTAHSRGTMRWEGQQRMMVRAHASAASAITCARAIAFA